MCVLLTHFASHSVRDECSQICRLFDSGLSLAYGFGKLQCDCCPSYCGTRLFLLFSLWSNPVHCLWLFYVLFRWLGCLRDVIAALHSSLFLSNCLSPRTLSNAHPHAFDFSRLSFPIFIACSFASPAVSLMS